jgi:pimeloyl-ACP methyl ester carboxylesterase
MHLRAALAGAVIALVCAPAAQAAKAPKVSFSRIAGYASPGTPAKYNKVGILKIGDPQAKNVLVLNPGTSASAAYFAPLAKTVVGLDKRWQVWSVERRENLLEDHSRLDMAKARKITPKQAFDYYLGYLADSNVKTHFQGIPDSDVQYAKQWGMNTEIQDLDRVVTAARQKSRRVVVGGHSLGGSITSAYATWDFNGTAGAADLAGLVFIDGGSGPTPVTQEQATQSLADLNKPSTSPWLTFGGFPAPLAGLFNSTGALGVELDPNSPSIGQNFQFLPANLKPSVPVTNIGLYGYALDTATSPTSLIAAQAHLGKLASKGNPRGWTRAGELTPIKRFADMFSGWGLKGLDGTAWYHPQRLTLDAGAVGAGNANPAQQVLDVHSTKGHDLPKSLRIYAFGAALGGQRVLDAAKALATQSGIPSRNLKLVDRHTTYAHNDPNSAYPKNDFIKNLIPFLKKLERK